MSNALKIAVRTERPVEGRRRNHSRRREVTLGDLIAAVIDATGGDARKARALLSSRELSSALRRRIVLI
jgi:hypothetical protein